MPTRKPSPPSPPTSVTVPPLSCLRGNKAGDGALLQVSVVPNAKRTEIVGLHDGDLRVRLAAPPVDGKANDTLTAWVAEQLGQPKRAVRLLRGASARQKQLEIDLPEAQVAAWLRRCLAQAAPG